MQVIEPLLAGRVPDWVESRPRDPELQRIADAWTEEHRHEVTRTLESLTKLCDRLPHAFRDNVPIVAEGNPTEEILNQIAAQGTNLAIVGATGKGTIERWLLGSVSEAVLTNAPCSVLVAASSG